jgi:hypothetical protein
MNKSKLNGDLYDIANRIKSIDDSYFIVRDLKHKRFEIHNKKKKGDSLCVVIPYDRLDARTLVLASLTRVERLKEIVGEIESHNCRLIKKDNSMLMELANHRLQVEFDKQK